MDQKRSRPNRRQHFFNRAKTVAERSTCLRRRVGAIIVDKDGVELSSGYSGAPRHTEHCIDIGECLRMELKIPSGQNYELCRAVHAEQNAIINAARVGSRIVGGIMYISSEKFEGAYPHDDDKDKVYGPCIICKKEIINAGLTAVYMREENVDEKCFTVEQIMEMLAEEEKEWKNKYAKDC